MRPQLNTNYRHLCSPSNPVTAELFKDYLPKAVKDISDTNCLSSKLTKDGRSNSVSKSSQRHTTFTLSMPKGGSHKQQSVKKRPEPPIHFRRKQEGKKKSD